MSSSSSSSSSERAALRAALVQLQAADDALPAGFRRALDVAPSAAAALEVPPFAVAGAAPGAPLVVVRCTVQTQHRGATFQTPLRLFLPPGFNGEAAGGAPAVALEATAGLMINPAWADAAQTWANAHWPVVDARTGLVRPGAATAQPRLWRWPPDGVAQGLRLDAFARNVGLALSDVGHGHLSAPPAPLLQATFPAPAAGGVLPPYVAFQQQQQQQQQLAMQGIHQLGMGGGGAWMQMPPRPGAPLQQLPAQQQARQQTQQQAQQHSQQLQQQQRPAAGATGSDAVGADAAAARPSQRADDSVEQLRENFISRTLPPKMRADLSEEIAAMAQRTEVHTGLLGDLAQRHVAFEVAARAQEERLAALQQYEAHADADARDVQAWLDDWELTHGAGSAAASSAGASAGGFVGATVGGLSGVSVDVHSSASGGAGDAAPAAADAASSSEGKAADEEAPALAPEPSSAPATASASATPAALEQHLSEAEQLVVATSIQGAELLEALAEDLAIADCLALLKSATAPVGAGRLVAEVRRLATRQFIVRARARSLFAALRAAAAQ